MNEEGRDSEGAYQLRPGMSPLLASRRMPMGGASLRGQVYIFQFIGMERVTRALAEGAGRQ